jgi:hypothetical protein
MSRKDRVLALFLYSVLLPSLHSTEENTRGVHIQYILNLYINGAYSIAELNMPRVDAPPLRYSFPQDFRRHDATT